MTFAHALALALSGQYLRRALLVMGIVGTILNLINQGDALLRGHGVDMPKLLLTCVVPFCVATYGAASALASRKPTPLESP